MGKPLEAKIRAPLRAVFAFRGSQDDVDQKLEAGLAREKRHAPLAHAQVERGRDTLSSGCAACMIASVY